MSTRIGGVSPFLALDFPTGWSVPILLSNLTSGNGDIPLGSAILIHIFTGRLVLDASFPAPTPCHTTANQLFKRNLSLAGKTLPQGIVPRDVDMRVSWVARLSFKFAQVDFNISRGT